MAVVLAAIGWGPDRGFDQAMRGLLRSSFAVTRIFQHGRLDIYLTVTFLSVALILLVPPSLMANCRLPALPTLLLHEWAIFAIAVIGLVAVALRRIG